LASAVRHERVLAGAERLYSLDVLRGLAALAVVFWHWQHFFFVGSSPGPFDAARLPGFALLEPLYTKGWLAVDLFFCLSGFVFYWLYAHRVASGRITAARFALLRFSRLYPLHVATLLAVGAMQIAYWQTEGHAFVYPHHDAWHLFLHVFLASSWGFERGFSFNGPIWSVSVEALLYAAFFLVTRWLPVRAPVPAAFAGFGYLVLYDVYSPLGRGVGSFFLGGCAFFAFKTIVGSTWAVAMTRWVTYGALVVWLTTLTIRFLGLDVVGWATGQVGIDHPLVVGSVARAVSLWPVLVMFPTTILALALMETLWGSIGRRLSILGDISYSIYLIHFPMQLGVALVVARMGGGEETYYSAPLMLMFFVALVVLSTASYRCFEMPVQHMLRFGRNMQVLPLEGK